MRVLRDKSEFAVRKIRKRHNYTVCPAGSGSGKIVPIIFNGHYRMKHRTWLIEVLRLHFEEKLPRIEAGRRLGIPKTTACDLFVRFRKAGLSAFAATDQRKKSG